MIRLLNTSLHRCHGHDRLCWKTEYCSPTIYSLLCLWFNHLACSCKQKKNVRVVASRSMLCQENFTSSILTIVLPQSFARLWHAFAGYVAPVNIPLLWHEVWHAWRQNTCRCPGKWRAYPEPAIVWRNSFGRHFHIPLGTILHQCDQKFCVLKLYYFTTYLGP